MRSQVGYFFFLRFIKVFDGLKKKVKFVDQLNLSRKIDGSYNEGLKLLKFLQYSTLLCKEVLWICKIVYEAKDNLQRHIWPLKSGTTWINLPYKKYVGTGSEINIFRSSNFFWDVCVKIKISKTCLK